MQSPGGRFSNDDDPNDLYGDEGTASESGGPLLPPDSDDEDTDNLDGTADLFRSLRVQGDGSGGITPVPTVLRAVRFVATCLHWLSVNAGRQSDLPRNGRRRRQRAAQLRCDMDPDE